MIAPPPSPTVVPLPGLDLPRSWRLTPGVRFLWRGDGSFQLEHDDDGVVVTGLDRQVAATLARPPRDPLTPSGPGPATADVDLAALHRLAELGFVRIGPPLAPVRRPPGPALPSGPLTLVPDLDPATPGSQSGVPVADPWTPDPGATDGTEPVAEWERRAALRTTRVEVVGLTAVSAYVGALVAAAGVGAVGFASTGVVTRRHLLPGGLAAADEGRRFAAAAADVVARAAPRTDVGPPADHEPDLVVLCLDAPVDPDLRDLLHRTRRAHLVVHVDGTRGEVGPLVLPGVSACLRCADLHRLDHDPSWTVLAVQLIARAGTGEPPDPGLTARTGALAAALAVRWLTGDPLAGDTLDGSWEIRSGRIAPRRRRRRPHPECGCRAAWA